MTQQKQYWDILDLIEPLYGNKKNIGPGKLRWLQELRLERENDIKAETIGQYGIRNMKQ